jgi:hypothetical protein
VTAVGSTADDEIRSIPRDDIGPTANDRARRAVADDPASDGRVAGTAEERLVLVAELSLRSWTLTGAPLPSDPRSAIPGKLTTLSDQ